MTHAPSEGQPVEDQPARSSSGPGRRWWTEVGLVAAFWGVLAVLAIAKQALDPRFEGLPPGEAWETFLEYAIWAVLTPGIFWLARRFNPEREKGPRRVALHVAVALVVAVSVDLFGHATSNALTDGRQRPVTLAFSLFALHFLDEFIIYLVVLAAGFARDYFLRYRERLEEAARLRAQAARLQAQLAEARLHALRMQINPHFLFNTLHAVSTLVERDPRGVRRMIARLSTLLRYALESSSAQELPLKEELRFLEGYLEIQRIRFGSRLEATVEAAPDVLDALAPSLVLQPLVENAIKHGAEKADGVGRVAVRALRKDGRLVLSVRDNGPGLPPPAAASGDGAAAPGGQGVGLRNTRARLESLYGEDQALTLEEAEGGGLLARITLPYHTSADLRAVSLSDAP